MKIQVLICSLLLFAGCKKGGDTTPPVAKDISLITTTAVPGGLVQAQANFKPSKDTNTITVGGKKALAVAADSNMIVFFMPELPAGTNATVDFKNIGVNKQFTISVGNYTAITQPDQVFNTAMLEQDQIIRKLTEYKNDPYIRLDPGYIDMIQYIKQGITSKYNSLSADEKIQIAYVMQSNHRDTSFFQMEAQDSSIYTRTQLATLDPEDHAWSRSGLILSLGAVGLIQVAEGIALVGAGMYVAPAGVFGVLLGTAFSVAGAWMVLDGFETITTAWVAAIAMSKSVIKAQPGISSGGILNLEKDINLTAVFKGYFNSFTQNDASSTNALLTKTNAAIEKAKEAKAKMLQAFEKIKVFFLGNPPAIPADNLQIGTSPVTKTIPMQGAKLSLNNVSNPGISVTFSRGDASLAIKATSTTVTQETPFTVDATYTNPTTGTTITQTVNCVFKPIPDSLSYYKNLVLGVWSNSWYTGANFNQFYEDDRIDVQPNGVAMWFESHYSNGTVTQNSTNVTWSLTRSGNDYIMHIGAQFGRITPTNLSFSNFPSANLKTITSKL